jgi:stringent starvation protein B
MGANTTIVSTKPYLIRAIYEWCVDQGFTPHVAAIVDAHTVVPAGYVRNGQIVLNVGPEATNQLVIDNQQISFQARFNGVVHHIVVPVGNVAAIYARENGQGMAFETGLDVAATAADDAGETTGKPPGGDNDTPPPPPPRGGHLKVVK